MKKCILVILLIFLLCFAFACQKRGPEIVQKPKADRAADMGAIKTLVAEWARLYNARDFDRLMSVFYADEAVVMNPNMPVDKGKAAIRLTCEKDDKLYIEHVEDSIVEDVRVSGDLAVARGRDTGTETRREGGKPSKYDLKWLMVFGRQADGTWKCLDEIWNDNPLPGTPEKQP